jgi:hypothetical protein
MLKPNKLIPDNRNVREINLPKIPQHITKKIYADLSSNEYVVKWRETEEGNNVFNLTDSFNKELNDWAKLNICDSVYYEFQIITADTHIHKDDFYFGGEDETVSLKLKFIYLLETGGNNVRTEFYDEDQTTLLEYYNIELHKWYIFKVDGFHRVVGIEPNKPRIAIVGHVF